MVILDVALGKCFSRENETHAADYLPYQITLVLPTSHFRESLGSSFLSALRHARRKTGRSRVFCGGCRHTLPSHRSDLRWCYRRAKRRAHDRQKTRRSSWEWRSDRCECRNSWASVFHSWG